MTPKKITLARAKAFQEKCDEDARRSAEADAPLALPTVAAFQANLSAAIEQIAGRLELSIEQADKLALSGMALRRHKRIGAASVVRELAIVAGTFAEEAWADSRSTRN